MIISVFQDWFSASVKGKPTLTTMETNPNDKGNISWFVDHLVGS